MPLRRTIVLASVAQRAAVLPVAALALAGCPAAVGDVDDATQVEQVGAADPRVLQNERTGDLYPRDVRAMPEEDPGLAADASSPSTPGVGKPDETNGTCRLYAEEYPSPACCPGEYGVDAERVKELCGFQLYLGEYARQGCGYSFRKTPTSPTETLWIARLGDVSTTAEAKANQEMFIQRRFKQPDFHTDPIPGVAGGYRSVFSKQGWAALPGWNNVRQVGYREGFCGDALDALLADIASAKEPPAGAERSGLVPTARR